MKLSWSEAESKAQDQAEWRSIVGGLCSGRSWKAKKKKSMKMSVAFNQKILNRAHDFFCWFPKMYFQFPRHHVDIFDRDVTEPYTMVNSPRSPWQCLKSAWPYLLQFWRYRGKVDWWAFYPQLPGLVQLSASKHIVVYVMYTITYSFANTSDT